MVDREKVIKGLECCAKDNTCDACPYDQDRYNANGPCALVRDTLELIKAQKPSVMTWHEVIGAMLECKPVFIEVRYSEDKERGDDRWSMLTQYKDSITMICAMSSYITSEILFKDCYGKTWRCWTSRPTDEQREATPWKK